MTIRTLMDLVLAVICWAAVTTMIALRLTGMIKWPWLWVTAPLWLPLIGIAGGFAAALFSRVRLIKS